MGANDLQQSLLETMQLISNKTVNSTNAPVVIKGEIVEETDESTHQYTVTYAGVIYEDVFSIANAKYPSASVVYILVPDGDYSNKKWILGSVEPSSDENVIEEKQDLYIPISDNLFGNINEIRLKSWEEVNERKINIQNISAFSLVFKDYLSKYRTFLLSVSIKTDIDLYHRNQGYYGLKLELPFIETSTSSKIWKTYYLDTNNIEGDPYNFAIYQKVNLYFTVEDGYEYDKDRNCKLTVSVRDFNYSENEIIEIEKVKSYDIFIKDFSISMIDMLTEEEHNGYYVSLVASKGNYFLSGAYDESEKVITPVFKINGKTSSLKGWQCYWFVEDAAIDTTSNEYLQLGGIGWKCLNRKTNITQNSEGKTTFDYITDDYSLTIQKESILVALRYKCVLVKVTTNAKKQEKTVSVWNIISLKNLNSRVSLTLKTVTGSNVFAEGVANVQLLAQVRTDEKIFDQDKLENQIYGYTTVWKRFDKNGNYIENEIININENEDEEFFNIDYPFKLIEKSDDGFYTYEMKINFPSSIVDKSNTIYCTFYKLSNNKQINIGTRSILITTTPELSYNVIITNGDVVYKYDSDGDSPMIANYDGPLSSKINSIMPLSFQIFKPDGYELNEEEYKYVRYKWYVPSTADSLYKSFTPNIDREKMSSEIINGNIYYIIKGSGLTTLNYEIDDKYNKSKANNNMIKLIVEYNNNQIETSIHPKFIKDGENGTNGSKYSAIISCVADGGNGKDYEYEELDSNGLPRKLHLVWVKGEDKEHPEKGKWYIHNQDSNTLTEILYKQKETDKNYDDFKNYCPLFKVTVYKDGVNNSGFTINSVNWKMFDDAYKGKKNCFNIIKSDSNKTQAKLFRKKDVVKEDGTIEYPGSWQEKKTDDVNKIVPCSIVQCEITITGEESTLGVNNTEHIFAFYPIEVTYLEKYDTSSYPMIPTFEGGFSEVLYDIDGNNPEWDKDNLKNEDNDEISKYNFRCSNDIEKLTTNVGGEEIGYNYTWNVSSNLKLGETNGRFAKVSPKTKYKAGDTYNYVKVTYTWTTAGKNIIKEKIDNLIAEIESIEAKRNLNIGRYIESNNGNYNRINYNTDDIYKGYSEDYKYIWVKNKTGHYDLDPSFSNIGNRGCILGLYDNYFSKTKIEELQELLDKDFLKYIKNSFKEAEFLKIILDSYEKILTVSEIKELYGSETYLVDLRRDLNRAIYNLYFLGQNGGTSLGDLVTLNEPNDTIDISEDKLNSLNDNKKKIELQTWILDWDVSISKYKGCIAKLIHQTNDRYDYLDPFTNLQNFKNRILIIINSDYYTKLRGDYQDHSNETVTDLYPDDKERSSYSYNNFYIDSTPIDKFKTQIETLRDIINPEMGSSEDPLHIFPLVYSYEEYINDFIKPLKKAFNDLYINKAYQNNYYDGKDSIQDIFYYALDEKRKLRDYYNTLYQDTVEQISSIHIKPILTRSNTTGLGYINGWDGTRMYVDPSNEAYIMAPIMGAGQKDDKGSFTGVVMGIKNLNGNTNKDKQLVGLHGFSNNQTSFFINAKDGSAVFGKSSSGQIIIDPQKDSEEAGQGLLYNSGYFIPVAEDGDEYNLIGDDLKPKNYNKLGETVIKYNNKEYYRHGMLIKFTSNGEKNEETGLYTDPPYIHFADVNGKIYSGNHSELSSIKQGFYLSHDGLSIGSDFYVSSTGILTSLHNGSNIGNWKIKEKEINAPLLDENGNHVVDEKGNWVWERQVKKGLISSKNSGIFMDAESGTISLGSWEGRISSGEHWYRDAKANGFYLSHDGLSIGKNFSIETDGIATIHLGDSEGKIYSGSHNSLDSVKKGFFIDDKGLSIWNTFKVEKAKDPLSGAELEDYGQVLIGNLRWDDTEKKQTGKYWTIGGIIKEYTQVPKHPVIHFGESYTADLFAKDIVLTTLGEKEGDLLIYQSWMVKEEQGIIHSGDIILPDMVSYIDEPYNQQYDLVPNSSSIDGSYIAYNTGKLGVYEEEIKDVLGNDYYSRLSFQKNTSKNQIYIGTDGFRLGKSFAMNNDGVAYFKGNIEASHGLIGGWTISKYGLFNKKGEIEDYFYTDLYHDPHQKEEWLQIQYGFVVASDGDIGFVYIYAGDEDITVSYEDPGTRRENTQNILRNPILNSTITEEWFGKVNWRGYDDGTLDVYSQGSHFGGVALMGTKDNGYTYYNTNFKEHDSVEKVFGEGFRSAIGKIISENTKNFVTQDMLKDYVVKGTYHGTGSGTVTGDTCDVTVSINLGDE